MCMCIRVFVSLLLGCMIIITIITIILIIIMIIIVMLVAVTYEFSAGMHIRVFGIVGR